MLAAVSMWALEDSEIQGGDYVDIASGGIQAFKPDAEPPALYLSQQDAIDSWFRSAWNYGFHNFKPTSRFKWVTKPELDRWVMTTQHSTGSHRQVETRFSVYSRIMVTHE